MNIQKLLPGVFAVLFSVGTAQAAELGPIPAPKVFSTMISPGVEMDNAWQLHLASIQSQKSRAIGACKDCIPAPIATKHTLGKRWISKKIAFKLFALGHVSKHRGLRGRVTEAIPLTRKHRAWQHPVGLTVDYGLIPRQRTAANIASKTVLISQVGLKPVYETSTYREANSLAKKFPAVFTLKRRGHPGNLLPLEGYVNASHWSVYNNDSISDVEIAKKLDGVEKDKPKPSIAPVPIHIE